MGCGCGRKVIKNLNKTRRTLEKRRARKLAKIRTFNAKRSRISHISSRPKR